MRFWGRVVAVLAVAGCSGSVPNADHITGQNVPILASSVASDGSCRMARSSRRSSSTTRGMRASSSVTFII